MKVKSLQVYSPLLIPNCDVRVSDEKQRDVTLKMMMAKQFYSNHFHTDFILYAAH